MNNEVKKIITKEIAWHYRVVPSSFDGKKLVLLTDADSEQNILSELEVVTGKKIILEKTSSEQIEKLLFVNYRKSSDSDAITRKDLNIVEEVVNEAISLNSSDIHFEIYENETRIRYRIDGLLTEKKQFEKNIFFEIVNIIKIVSNLDITEKRLPQDGKTKILEHDIRVSVIPTQFGEKVVLRILGKNTDNLDLTMLGFDATDLELYKEAISKTKGIILISGPTGSGKTTTLYATLKLLNKPEKNIMTVEDPVEYVLPGVNQIQLNESIGLDFSTTLKSFLRQDPDVIMLGEIRDKKTAEMAIRASLTGHLVLSTIHTNSAIGTISRLIDMGIPAYLIADTISLSIAQRLVRKLCGYCKKEVGFDKDQLPSNFSTFQDTTHVYEPVGCSECHYTGYKGRIAIYEMLNICLLYTSPSPRDA